MAGNFKADIPKRVFTLSLLAVEVKLPATRCANITLSAFFLTLQGLHRVRWKSWNANMLNLADLTSDLVDPAVYGKYQCVTISFLGNEGRQEHATQHQNIILT